MFQQRRQHTIFFPRICERQKKSCRVSPFPRQLLSYQSNGEKLKLVTRRWKSTGTYRKQRNGDMNRTCRDMKKIIWTKWRSSGYTKDAIRQPQRQPQRQTQMQVQRQLQRQAQRQLQRLLGVDTTFSWDSSLVKWQRRIGKTIVVLYQEGGKRLKKIQQGYLHTTIQPDRWRMK